MSETLDSDIPLHEMTCEQAIDYFLTRDDSISKKYRRKIATIEIYENGIHIAPEKYSPNGMMLALKMRQYGIDHWKEYSQKSLIECEEYIKKYYTIVKPE